MNGLNGEMTIVGKRMTPKKKLFIVVWVIGVLFVINHGYCADKDRWVLYETVEIATHYYDKNSIIQVPPKIIRVWTKEKFSQATKDRMVKTFKDTSIMISKKMG